MRLLDIIEYPDPRLKTVARPVTRFDEALRRLADNMAHTMYAAPGVGLAATQVNVHERLLVVDVSETKDQLHVLVNPEVVWASEERVECEEGCLSVPGIYADVKRAESIVVKALDRDGQPFEISADGLLAVCIQHEMDHLAGKVFVDYLSPLKRELVRKKLAKQRRLEGEDAA